MRHLKALLPLSLLVVLLGTTPAHAQRGQMRGGKVYTPYGLAYDTASPEWRMAGGDLQVYQQIVAQKAMMKQQQAMIAQQRRYLAQQRAAEKAFERWARENPEAYLQWQAQQQWPQLRAARRRR